MGMILVPGWIVVAALAIGGVVAWFVVAARRARRRGDGSPVVSVALTVAAFWTAISVLGVGVGVVANLASESLQMTVPVATFWPGLLPGVEIDAGPTASVTGGGFTSADLLVADVSAASRITWTIGQALWGLIPAAIAALIAVACFRLLAGRAFDRIVVRTTVATAAVVGVGGVAAQVLSDIGGTLAASEVFTVQSARWEDLAGVDDVLAWWPDPGLALTVPFWPIGAALGLAALAAMFRYGSRLQRDTEGLV